MAVGITSAVQTLLQVLSADLSSDEKDLLTGGVRVCVDEHREGRFRFPIREKSLKIVTMGSGMVVSCSPDRAEWAARHLGGLTRDQVFSAQTVAKIQNFIRTGNQTLEGPVQKYVCSSDDLETFTVPPGVTLSIVRRDQIRDLHGLAENFPHALTRSPTVPAPTLAVVARCGGKVAGIAGASADCERMWQIGVDVLPEYRGSGIGRAVVGTLTKAVLAEGVLPYYSTAVGNLPSHRLAVSPGYWQAWIELYAR